MSFLTKVTVTLFYSQWFKQECPVL